MIFSLQRRFQLLVLLPVALLVIVAGVAGYIYARTFLFDQWVVSTSLQLEKAALEIRSQLNDKIELINLIAKAEEIPNHDITQAFLIQQLVDKSGVKFVDLDTREAEGRDSSQVGKSPEDYGPGVVEGLYTMELCDDIGFCSPVMDPGALDRSLRIVKVLNPQKDGPGRRLIVRIGFDSFLKPVRQMAKWRGSRAILVTSMGQILAWTDKLQPRAGVLGETGDEIEKKVLAEIKKKPFGTVFGKGYPPDVVVGFHKVPLINWYLILYSKGSEVLAPIVRFRTYYALAGIALFVAIVLLIRRTTCSVADSIGLISGAAEKVREGDYSVRLPEDRTDEIGRLNRSFNQMISGLAQRDMIQRTFGRYVDKSVAQRLMATPEALAMGGEKKVVTIMFADLRNFTSVSEKLEPEDVIRILNLYFARMIAIVERYKGIIVDFYGDSLLVFFDGMQPDKVERAADAVKCAIEMQREQESFVEESKAEGLPPLYMGIGIHTGEVIVGNIGTESRAKYGIVGSNVNLTARIQTTAGAGKIVVSEQTYWALSDRLTVSADFRVCLKGVERDRELYEVDSLDGEVVAA